LIIDEFCYAKKGRMADDVDVGSHGQKEKARMGGGSKLGWGAMDDKQMDEIWMKILRGHQRSSVMLMTS